MIFAFIPRMPDKNQQTSLFSCSDALPEGAPGSVARYLIARADETKYGGGDGDYHFDYHFPFGRIEFYHLRCLVLFCCWFALFSLVLLLVCRRHNHARRVCSPFLRGTVRRPCLLRIGLFLAARVVLLVVVVGLGFLDTQSDEHRLDALSVGVGGAFGEEEHVRALYV